MYNFIFSLCDDLLNSCHTLPQAVNKSVNTVTSNVFVVFFLIQSYCCNHYIHLVVFLKLRCNRYTDCNWTGPQNHLVCKQILSHLVKLFWVLICTVHFTVCSCHVTYRFQSESTLYSCPNVKELLAQSRRKSWSFKWLQLDSNPEPLSS